MGIGYKAALKIQPNEIVCGEKSLHHGGRQVVYKSIF
jgi:hypothetical protein